MTLYHKLQSTVVNSVISESGSAGSAYYQVSETHYFFYPLTRFSTVGSHGDRHLADIFSNLNQNQNFRHVGIFILNVNTNLDAK